MNSNLQNIGRLNPYLLLILITILVTACGGISAVLAFFSPDLLGGLLATLLLAAAIILPIQQKHFSFHSVFLIISGIAFLMSGVIENAYDTNVRQLPVLSQMEFSKFMRPAQVSRGLSNIGFGSIYALISLAWFQSKRLSEIVIKSKVLRVCLWLILVLGIVLTITGINSIVEGLSKL